METIALAAPYLIAGSTAVSAIGSIRQGNAAASAANYNANLAEQNAAIMAAQGNEAIRRQREANYKKLGSIRAAVGASGVQLDASPLDVLEESARNAEMDVLNTKYQYQLQSWGYNNSAALYRSQARQAQTAGYVGAAAQLLKGAASYAALSGFGNGTVTPQLSSYRVAANAGYYTPDI